MIQQPAQIHFKIIIRVTPVKRLASSVEAARYRKRLANNLSLATSRDLAGKRGRENLAWASSVRDYASLIAKLAATPKPLNPEEPVNGEQENGDEDEHARGGRKNLPGPGRKRRFLSCRRHSRSLSYRKFGRLLSCGSFSRSLSCCTELQ
jgi:hypothetical protein